MTVIRGVHGACRAVSTSWYAWANKSIVAANEHKKQLYFAQPAKSVALCLFRRDEGLVENIRVAPVFSGRPGPGQAWLRHESTSSRTTTIPAQPSSAPVVPNQIEGTKEPWAAASKVKKMEHNSLLSFDQ